MINITQQVINAPVTNVANVISDRTDKDDAKLLREHDNIIKNIR